MVTLLLKSRDNFRCPSLKVSGVVDWVLGGITWVMGGRTVGRTR